MAATPLGSLFSESWSAFQKYIKPIVVGALIFGSLTAATQYFLMKNVESGASSMMQGMGVDMDMERMEELGRRMEAGDEAAMEEFMAGMAKMGESMEGMSEDEQEAYIQGKMIGGFAKMLPGIGLVLILSLVIGLVASAYFSILVIKEMDDPMAILSKTPGLILPLLGLGIWIALRTFVWIPIIGLIPLIILGPRFIAASVYLVRDGKGVFESARLSYDATNGYWGKIIGNVIVMAIAMFIVSIVVGIATSMLGFASAFVALWSGQVAQQILSAYGLFFCVRLALTVMKNPIKA